MSVKIAITELCKILKAGQISLKVKPEHFRLAKNDTSEVHQIMLELLINIFLKKDSINKTTIQELNETLKIMNYPRIQHLYFDSPEQLSSQELLFCFSWSLSSTRLIFNILHQALLSVDPCNLYFSLKVNHEKSEVKSEATKLKMLNFKQMSSTDQIQYITLQLKKMKLFHDRLLVLKTQCSSLELKVSNKLHLCENISKKSLFTSTQQAFMMKYPASVDLVIKKLTTNLQILKSYLIWKENEKHFWMWLTVAINSKKSATSPSVVDLQKPEVFNDAAKDLIFNLEEIKRLLSKKKEEISQECRTKVKKVGIEQDLMLANNVDELLMCVENLHLKPTFQIKGSKDKIDEKKLAIHIKKPNQYLEEKLKLLNCQYQENLLKNNSILNDLLSNKFDEQVVLLPSLPTSSS